MHSSFRRDKYLKDLADTIGEYDVISVDIFDTLLFRTVYEPTDVFLTLGRYMQDEFPEHSDTPVEVLRQLRIEAERRAHEKARQNGVESVTLERIYDELHIWGDNRRRIMELETQAECEHVYVNPHMYSFARYCHERGKKLAITSDFYFTGNQLRNLLEHTGIDCGIFTEILVSCDYGVTKGGGRLFECLLGKFPNIPAGRILHIGDNQWSDVIPAHNRGLRTLWYPVVPETKGVPLDMERICYGSNLGALVSLRSLAMNTLPEDPFDADDCFWFREGAGIIGPVYALFAEWIVDTAVKENIKHILPFMREGELLAEVIRRAAENRGADLHVEPIFVSRRATVLLPCENLEAAIRKIYFHRARLNIGDLFDNLHLNIKNTLFADMCAMTLDECKKSGLFDSVSDYIFGESVLAQIREKVGEQRKLFAEYMRTLIGNDGAITVDFLCHGTTQTAVRNTMRICGHNNRILNLLAIGLPGSERLLLDGTELRCWLSSDTRMRGAIASFGSSMPVFESIVSAKVGVTLKYRKDGDAVAPALSPAVFPESELSAKDALWRGICCFQSHWFEIRKSKPHLTQHLMRKKDGFSSILLRLLFMPLNEEASEIGKLSFDDSFDRSYLVTTISNPDDGMTLKKLESANIPVYFECSQNNHDILWQPTYVERHLSNYYLHKYLCHKHFKHIPHSDSIYFFSLLSGKKDTLGRIAIFGFGVRGRKLAETLWLSGFPADVIADNFSGSWGCTIFGAKVMSPSDSVGLVDTYIISSSIHAEEMITEIRILYAEKKQPRIPFNGTCIK